MFQVELRQSTKFMERFSSTLLRDYLGLIREAIADVQQRAMSLMLKIRDPALLKEVRGRDPILKDSEKLWAAAREAERTCSGASCRRRRGAICSARAERRWTPCFRCTRRAR